MRLQKLLPLSGRLDLQAKISLVLLAVIVPTFVVVTIAENKLMKPIMAEQMKQMGITSATTLTTEIATEKLLGKPNSSTLIEGRLQELLYLQPSVRRMEVFTRENEVAMPKLIASSVEAEPGETIQIPPLVDAVSAEIKSGELGGHDWEIYVPIFQKHKDPKAPKKLLGVVRVLVSLNLVGKMINSLWETTATAAAVSVVLLILALSYFLRKTIANDRLLKRAETQNLQLTEQLHETERQLMNTEKLAVMGQLTASFAHEIGTPLSAIGGHLQLVKEEVTHSIGLADGLDERLGIIDGQLSKIEQIVKSFLQSTAKPTSQRQLVDPNAIVDQTLRIVRPRTDAMMVEVRRQFDRNMGPIRIVPVDLEQMLLNLVNNSLDSLRAKAENRESIKRVLELTTSVLQVNAKAWAVISIYDTGEGIPKTDLIKVFKAFYTTKRPGEGTGLGLTICSDLAKKYGGILEVDSKEGVWTQVTIKLPYQG